MELLREKTVIDRRLASLLMREVYGGKCQTLASMGEEEMHPHWLTIKTDLFQFLTVNKLTTIN